MKFPENIKNAMQALVRSKPEITKIQLGDNELTVQKKNGKNILLSIVPMPNPRVKEAVSTWLQALKQAEHPLYPRRYRLYRTYETVEIDGHISGLIGARVDKLKGAKFNICGPDGKPNDELTKLFKKKWYRLFITYAMNEKWNGHSLISFEFGDKPGKVNKVEEINRRHVLPEFGEILALESDLRGIPYRNTALMDYCIEVGEEKNLGLYKKAAPLALWKKNAFDQWSQLQELFALPFRSLKTPVRDEIRLNVLENIMKNMGSAGWGIFQDDEELTFHEQRSNDPYKVFDAMMDRINSELSKLYNHQTGTIDEKSFVGSAQVHEGVMDEVHAADKDDFKDLMNESVIPMLIKHGWPLEGCTYEYDDTKTLAPEVRIKVDGVLLQYYDIDPSEIEETYGRKVKIKATPQPEKAIPGGGGEGEPDPDEED